MSLINILLEHVYCNNLVSNHVLIMLIRFVSQFTVHLCNAIYFLTTFSTPCKRFTKILRFGCKYLNTALIEFSVLHFALNETKSCIGLLSHLVPLRSKISVIFSLKFYPRKSVILACSKLHLIKEILSTKKILYTKIHRANQILTSIYF